MSGWWKNAVSRRLFLAGGALIGGATRLRAPAANAQPASRGSAGAAEADDHGKHDGMITPGEVNHARNGFDPHTILTDWDTGRVSRLPDGRTLREFEMTAEDKEIEIAPGLMFPAWTYNGRVPGPSLRVSEGDRVRIRFQNFGSHPHSIHFHGIHSARMDG
ncbi:MAG: multicopper oxidase domain-containing protein, partial [Pseudomonadota bacterium]|nr:multicopper oxidase domain-containing protein [Pseudomonadota bacterium]